MSQSNPIYYRNTRKWTLSDGTCKVYEYKKKYYPKERKSRLLPDLAIQREIIAKWSLGVSKKRLCSDYGIPFAMLQNIVGNKDIKVQVALIVTPIDNTTNVTQKNIPKE
jgi:hypothetical protein